MLSTLADLGEFIGGVAVLVTIVYFAIQLRANLNANRAQAFSTWTTVAQNEKEVLYRDPEFSQIYRQVIFEGKAPTEDQAIQFYAYCIQLMNSWQLAFVQCQLGVMPEEFLERAANGYVRFASNEHVKVWWQHQGMQMYYADFADHVNKKMDRGHGS